MKLVVVVVLPDPTASEGWGRGGIPRRPNLRWNPLNLYQRRQKQALKFMEPFSLQWLNKTQTHFVGHLVELTLFRSSY